MTEKTILIPERWAIDNLSKFINLAQENARATFGHPEFRTICDVNILTDNCYNEIVKSLKDTKHLIPALLCLRAHSAYLSACNLALSGQGPEAFVMCRSCLEYSLYAFYIHDDTDRDALWLNRHDSEELLKRHRKEFTAGNALKLLEKEDYVLAGSAQVFYDRCIDFGGHPNPRAVTSTAVMEESSDSHSFKILYLATPEMDIFRLALQTTAQVGYLSISILRRIWGDSTAGSENMNVLVNIHKEWETLTNL